MSRCDCSDCTTRWNPHRTPADAVTLRLPRIAVKLITEALRAHAESLASRSRNADCDKDSIHDLRRSLQHSAVADNLDKAVSK